MSRVLLGLALSLAYIGAMIGFSARTPAVPVTEAATTTAFQECIVQAGGQYVGLRYHTLTGGPTTANLTWNGSAAPEARGTCSAVPAQPTASGSETSAPGERATVDVAAEPAFKLTATQP